MKKITILGAGLSTGSAIQYLLDRSEENDWQIRLGDYSEENAKLKINNHPRGETFFFDVNNEEMVQEAVSTADIVVSLLPAAFHGIIAESCVANAKNMLTASYVSPQMKALDQKAKDAGICILNELGVDPGIDHMSAMQIIDKIRNEGGKLESFHSSTGGLVAPQYDNNPWNYKFSWNPRNVVVAGQGISMFIRNGRLKYIPYNRLFERTFETSIDGYGDFEIYPNRDSLKYRPIYGLEDIPTIFRGTMRRPGYTRAWNVFVQLGMTDDTYFMEDVDKMTYKEFLNTFLKYDAEKPVREKLQEYLPFVNDDVMKKMEWLGIFEDNKIGLEKATPAQVLQKLMEEKMMLADGDKDMIAMQHIFVFTDSKGVRKEITSSLVVEGKDKVNTAMAITVGTPLAIATKFVAQGKFNVKGVHIPVTENLYEPILEELKEYGVSFKEVERVL